MGQVSQEVRPDGLVVRTYVMVYYHSPSERISETRKEPFYVGQIIEEDGETSWTDDEGTSLNVIGTAVVKSLNVECSNSSVYSHIYTIENYAYERSLVALGRAVSSAGITADEAAKGLMEMAKTIDLVPKDTKWLDPITDAKEEPTAIRNGSNVEMQKENEDDA